jgi:hypothetical protein
VLTHYCRRKLRSDQRLTNPVESLVYECSPQDRLATVGDIVAAAVARMGRDADYAWISERELADAVKSLAARNCLYEVAGPRLERVLGDL